METTEKITVDQFNSIEDLRSYFLQHPDPEKIKTACLHFLGDAHQEFAFEQEQKKKLPPYDLSGLYYKYGKSTDEDIRKFLSHAKIVVLENKGVGTVHGYYPLNEEAMKKVLEKPRNVSLTFDATKTEEKLVEGLREYKDIMFLVKSSSRFFLKPDIGEVIDQIDFHDKFGDTIKGIRLKDGYTTLPATEGEHFLMIATLFK